MERPWLLVAGGGGALLVACAFALAPVVAPPTEEPDPGPLPGLPHGPTVSTSALPPLETVPDVLAPLVAQQFPESRLGRVLLEEARYDAAHFPGEWLPPAVESEDACAALEAGATDSRPVPVPIGKVPALHDYDISAE